MVGVREIELCREIGTDTGLEEADKRVMRRVNAGGLWTGKHGEKAGYLDSQKCKLCGVETPTMVDAYKHMFWKCERLSDHRSEADPGERKRTDGAIGASRVGRFCRPSAPDTECLQRWLSRPSWHRNRRPGRKGMLVAP